MLAWTAAFQIWRVRAGGQRWREFVPPADRNSLPAGSGNAVIWRRDVAGGCPRTRLTLARMGLVQALEYEVPRPNAAQRALWHVSSSPPGAWLFARSGPPVDTFLLRLSKGQVTLAKVVAGLPVITIVTTGARTGRARAAHLLGIPFAGDLAVIGTRFGQKGTPGWYYNIRADPAIQVIYRDKKTEAVAREAQAEERQAIWEQARQIYAGYEAYARRIKDRKIHIMLLSMQATSASGPERTRE